MHRVKHWTTAALAAFTLTSALAWTTPATAGPPDNASQSEAASEARARSAPVDRVTALLRTIEGLPARDAFEKAADAPDAVLWQILTGDADAPVRTAALDALARWWPSDRVLDRLRERIDGEDSSLMTRVKAVAILGRSGFDAPARELLADALSPDRHLQVRLAAVSALGQRDTEAADAILRARARSEQDELVFERIGWYLKD